MALSQRTCFAGPSCSRPLTSAALRFRRCRAQCSSSCTTDSTLQPGSSPRPSVARQLATTVQQAAAAIREQRAAASDTLCRLLGGNQQQLGSLLLCAAAAAGPLRSSASSVWADLASNYVFCVGFCGWFLAQFLKIFTKRYKTGVWDARAFFDSGGMPSSHSALCSSVTTAIAMQQGLGSPLFAVAVCFRHAHAGHARCHPVLCYANCPGGAEQHWQATTGAPHQHVIVMYDAMGIRRHAGLQAELLNVVVGEVLEGHPMSARKLKEVLGHTPRQVCAGMVLGILVGLLFPILSGIAPA
ncbi:hypothetical protein CHLNCDRAFT_137734 [Chlorella variabilis]|uniref:Uncharacterized protein n=1 Tax=Chlorella variabilis TaxID=554065 RepID=E1Z4D2_CHLVA|nr:hypothetical protein CHLNCDRAFT_137734 [Chlorella variabilis]EFN59036.1 hypothetical protein CHLNCDRAFT_137734 [Chlorella variabilis]|eukprot:XP_005851138.1 hypothetical protein CHLNCDRAFT_137734 [Chlorella variabilis]